MSTSKIASPALMAAAFTLSLTASVRTGGMAATTQSITIAAVRHTGAEAIDVSGTAPARRPLMITLISTFSRDLPDVVLSRTVVVPDDAGAFSGTMSIAPDFTRGSIITISATTLRGGPAAHTTFRPDWPNDSVPLDEDPRSVR